MRVITRRAITSRYLAKKARARECSYDAKESQGISAMAYLDHLTARYAQEAPVEEGLYEALHEAMATLDERMQEALWALACGGDDGARAGGGVAVEQVDVPRSQGACAEAAARGALRRGDMAKRIINEGCRWRIFPLPANFFLRCPTKRAFFLHLYMRGQDPLK